MMVLDDDMMSSPIFIASDCTVAAHFNGGEPRPPKIIISDVSVVNL